MARNSDPLSDSFGTDESDGWLGGLVADEDGLDRHTLWRLGLWGVAAVGALTLGILSGQLPVTALRTQVAANEFAGRARQVEASIHDNQIEARRLSAAIDTLNSDRDRLFSRLSSIEQNLDVVTGSIRKADEKAAATPWPDPSTARLIDSAPFAIAAPPSAPAQTPSTPQVLAAVAPTEPAPAVTPAPAAPEVAPPAEASAPAASPPPVIQAMPIPEPQAVPEEPEKAVTNETPVAVAEFGIDLGTANSINGLRALWRGLVKSHKAQLDGLRPLISVQERRNGLGVQLRLIAGPIKDAAAVARICVVLDNANRDCKMTNFDGQRLSVATEPEERAAPASAKPTKQRRSTRVRQPKPEVQQAATERPSTMSTLLGIR
jgi:hypothetical protein